MNPSIQSPASEEFLHDAGPRWDPPTILDGATQAADLQDPRPTGNLSPWRQRLLTLVRNDPGCVLAQTRRETGLRHATLLRHLVPLMREERVFAATLSENSRRVFLFPHVQDIESACPQIVALRDVQSARIYAALTERRSLDHRALWDLAQKELDLNRISLRTRLRVLMDASLIAPERRDSARRTTLYRALAARRPALRVIKASQNPGHVITKQAHRPAAFRY